MYFYPFRWAQPMEILSNFYGNSRNMLTQSLKGQYNLQNCHTTTFLTGKTRGFKMAFIYLDESDATHKHKRCHNPIFTGNSAGLLRNNVHSYIYNHEKNKLKYIWITRCKVAESWTHQTKAITCLIAKLQAHSIKPGWPLVSYNSWSAKHNKCYSDSEADLETRKCCTLALKFVNWLTREK